MGKFNNVRLFLVLQHTLCAISKSRGFFFKSRKINNFADFFLNLEKSIICAYFFVLPHTLCAKKKSAYTAHLSTMHTHTHTHTQTHTPVRMYLYVYSYTHEHYVYTHTHTLMAGLQRVVFVSTAIYTCTHTRTNTHTHTQIHTYI
jgi:hypothetical protein